MSQMVTISITDLMRNGYTILSSFNVTNQCHYEFSTQ